MQTPQEKVRTFYPDAKVMPYPPYPDERVFIGTPISSAHGYSCLSRVAPVGIREDELWQDALDQLVAMARILVEGESR